MRKLVAIMFTDIEGYTSLMQQNESNAILQLSQYKQLILQQIRQYDGRLIKYVGDGTLSAFNSSFHAVSCAVALQKECCKAKIPVRIGIHQGEVIFENKDVFGDAVNLSSRIQNAGVSGSVLISEKVNDELINHPELKTVHLGSFILKNVNLPVQLFAIRSEGLVVPLKVHSDAISFEKKHIAPAEEKATIHHRQRWKLPLIITIAVSVLSTVILLSTLFRRTSGEEFRSIAVLPFRNIGAVENTYISEGLTEEIINLLSSNLRLKVRRVPQKFLEDNGRSNLAGILLQSDIGNVLEGAVQHFGDSLKIFVRVTDNSNNEILWNRDYTRKYSEQISFQQELAREIAGAMQSGFTNDEIRKMAKRNPVRPDAIAWYNRGRYEQNKRSPESMKEAINLFRKALDIDPKFPLAWTAISDNYALLADNGIISFDSGYNNARYALQKAFELDSNLSEVRASKALFLSSLEGRRKEAMHELELALMLNPNFAYAHQWLAAELAADGKFDEALKHINKSIEIEPFTARPLRTKNSILMFARKYPAALQVQDQYLKIGKDTADYNELRADCFYRMGKKDSARLFAGKIRDGIKDQIYWSAVLDGEQSLLTKRVHEDSSLKDLETQALYYTCLNNYKEALDKIETAFAIREYGWLKFLNVDPDWEPLKQEPRFADLIRKLNIATQ